MWEEPLLEENFDIIIEDGLHQFHANVCFFENSIHKSNKNGYFIIEDISFRDYPLFVEKIPYWEFCYSDCSFTLLNIPLKTNHGDNTLLVVFKS